MRTIFLTLVFCIVYNISFSQAYDIEIKARLKILHADIERELEFGIDPKATNEIDDELGEYELPPFPPSFEARFVSETMGEGSYKDFRKGSKNENLTHVHIIQYENLRYSASEGKYNSLILFFELPSNVFLVIKDPANGALYSDTIIGNKRYELKYHTIFNSFIMECKYVALDEYPGPVELSSFTGKYFDGIILLEWTTITELNNFGFFIERKSNSGDWETISFMKGSGNSSSYRFYKFIDRLSLINLDSEKIYYRLKQIDFNGTYSYSDAIEVQLPVFSSKKNKIELLGTYPNPFNSFAKISYISHENLAGIVKIYDSIGKIVFEKKISIIKGKNEFVLQAENFSSGAYYFVIATFDAIVKGKFQIIK